MWTKFLILKSIKTVFSRGQSFLECFRLSLAESSKVARYDSYPNRVFHTPFDISQVQSGLIVSSSCMSENESKFLVLAKKDLPFGC